MNVKELKEAIADLPDDMEVILQKDAEGNGYSPLQGDDTDCIYVAETTWYGEVYSIQGSDKESAEHNGMELEDWKALKDEHPQALVLFPVN